MMSSTENERISLLLDKINIPNIDYSNEEGFSTDPFAQDNAVFSVAETLGDTLGDLSYD